MSNNQEISHENHESDFNIREQVEKYLVHWKWFVLSVIVVLCLAFLYLRYTTPLYKATATILVKDDKKGGLASELSVLSDLGVGTSKSNVDNEVEILKSRTLTEKTVNELHLNINYLSNGRVKSSELYKASPIVVVFSPADEKYKRETHTFVIESAGADKFKLFKAEDKELGTFNYGSLIKTPQGTLSVTKVNLDSKETFSINCIIRPVESTTSYYRDALSIGSVGKNTSVIELSVADENSQRAADFLNTLVNIYNEDAIEDKNIVAEKTSDFISTRLKLITDELTDVEKDVEGFKKQNDLTDIPTEATMFLENASEYEKKQIETEIQLNVVFSMRQFLNSSGPDDLIPSNLLSTQSEASDLIMEYNKLVIEYNRIAAGATPENPVVANAAKKIQAMKSNISQSLGRMQSSLTITKKNLDKQGLAIGNKKAKVPRLEREFRIIDRQQKVKEALYLYLLQKRERQP
ncbi:GumC family protein [Flavobacterium microcysteis]